MNLYICLLSLERRVHEELEASDCRSEASPKGMVPSW